MAEEGLVANAKHPSKSDFSKSEREIMKAKLALTVSGSNKLARDMAKNKLIFYVCKMEQNTSILHHSHL